MTSDPRHGDLTGYTDGCRDACCRGPKTRYMKHWRHGLVPHLVPAVGSHRRIHALMALGWRKIDIGRAMGIKERGVGNILAETRLQAATAARVTDAYERLSMTLGPSQVTAKRARQRGWPVPLAWDDDTIDNPDAKPYTGRADRRLVDPVVIQRALDGGKVHANPDERRAIIARWKAAGRPLNELDRIQGWNSHRDRRAA